MLLYLPCLRSDYSQHAVCLPDEDQKGVVVLCSYAPPAGPTLRCASRHAANSQHFLHGTDRSGDRSVPPLKSLCAISPRKGCLLRAASAGGTLILSSVKTFSQCLTFVQIGCSVCRFLSPTNVTKHGESSLACVQTMIYFLDC